MEEIVINSNKRTIENIEDDDDIEIVPSKLHPAFRFKGNLANHILLSDGSMLFSTPVEKMARAFRKGAR